MAKIAQEIIDKIPEAYARLKTFAAVSRELGIAPATVSRYVAVAKTKTVVSSYEGPRPSRNPSYKIFSNFLILTPIEIDSCDKYRKEILS